MAHSIEKCKDCLLTKENRCMAFYERSNPILGEFGDCIARTTDPLKLEELIEETDWEEMRE